MNEEFLTLLESEDVVDNIIALSVFESNYDAMYEDSDPTDGVSDSEVEAIKRRKEKQKQIIKIIAICAGGIAACGVIAATVVKLKKKGELSDSDAKRIKDKADKNKGMLEKIRDTVKGLGKEKRLSEAQCSRIDELEKRATELSEQAKLIKDGKESQTRPDLFKNPSQAPEGSLSKVFKGFRKVDKNEYSGKSRMRKVVGPGEDNTADQIPLDSKRLKDAINDGLRVKIGDYVVVTNSADDYDRMVDAILEKYNDDMIDAETCIALMERAAERYTTDDIYDDE